MSFDRSVVPLDLLSRTSAAATGVGESLQALQQSETTVVAPLPPTAAYDIVQCGSDYSVSLYLESLNLDTDKGRALLVWLYERTSQDTIHLSISNVYFSESFSSLLLYFSPLVEALLVSKATTIGLATGLIFSIDAYVLLACTKIECQPYASMILTPAADGMAETPTVQDRIVQEMAGKLYQRACAAGVLTKNDITLLEDARQVMIPSDRFAAHGDE